GWASPPRCPYLQVILYVFGASPQIVILISTDHIPLDNVDLMGAELPRSFPNFLSDCSFSCFSASIFGTPGHHSPVSTFSWYGAADESKIGRASCRERR